MYTYTTVVCITVLIEAGSDELVEVGVDELLDAGVVDDPVVDD